MTPDTDPETALGAAYREQSECYGQALRAAEELRDELRAGRDGSGPRARLGEWLAAAAEAAGRVTELQARCPSPGAEALAARRALVEQVERLAACVRLAQREAEAYRDQLQGEVEAASRASRMRRAYGGGA